MGKKKGKIKKVPSNGGEALKSDLMGLLEKRRCQKFFSYCEKFDINKPETHKKYDVKNMKFGELTK